MPRLLPLLLLLFAFSCTHAFPTLTGPTGLIMLPDAYPADARITLAGDVAENPGDPSSTLRAVYGLPSGEVGVLYAIDDETMTGVNGKYCFPLDRLHGDGAIGAIYLNTASVTERCLYLAITRPGTLSVTGGITWTEISTIAGKADAARPYLGAVLSLPQEMCVVSEYQLHSTALYEPKPIFSVMLVRKNGLFTTTVGATNAAALLGAEDRYFFAGITMAMNSARFSQ